MNAKWTIEGARSDSEPHNKEDDEEDVTSSEGEDDAIRGVFYHRIPARSISYVDTRGSAVQP